MSNNWALANVANIIIQGPCGVGKTSSKKITLEVKAALFSIIDGRWGLHPVIITSQMAITEYRELLGSDQSAEGVIDRLLKPAKILTMQGKSKRPVL